MSFGELRERYGRFYTPRFALWVGGRKYTDADGMVSDITVETALRGTNSVSFTATDVFDHESGAFTISPREVFEPGTSLKVRLGYGDQLRTVFVGEIDSTRPQFPVDGAATISVEGSGLTHRMTEGEGTGVWRDTTLEDVVRAVFDEYGFDHTVVEDNPEEPIEFEKKSVDPEQSNYDFLQRKLARRYGFELFARDETVYFRTPKPDGEPVLTLTYGRLLQSFQPGDVGSPPDVGTVEVRGWDSADKEAVVGEAEVVGGGSETETFKESVDSVAEAERIAVSKARKIEQRGDSHGETLGLPELEIGRVITVDGIGDRYSGEYYVESTTHRFDRQGYTTSFDVTEESSNA